MCLTLMYETMTDAAQQQTQKYSKISNLPLNFEMQKHALGLSQGQQKKKSPD